MSTVYICAPKLYYYEPKGGVFGKVRIQEMVAKNTVLGHEGKEAQSREGGRFFRSVRGSEKILSDLDGAGDGDQS
jgi:hypothetical protein